MSTLATFQGATTDEWEILNCVGAQKLRIQASNAAVLLNFGLGIPGAVQWDSADEPYLPIVGSIVRPFDAIRFMSLVEGKPANLILIPTVQ